MRLHRWWTPLSAGWLHGNLPHIVFNLMWIRQLAPAIGELYGPGRMVIIYTAGSVVGFTTTTLAGVVFGDVNIPFLSPGVDDHGRLGGHFRAAWRARLLRSPVRLAPDSQPGDQLGDDRASCSAS